MKRRLFFAWCSAALYRIGFASETNAVVLSVSLNDTDPGSSNARLREQPDFYIPVGFGKRGLKEAGSAFEGGYSLLGKFRVNAILTKTHFKMEDRLVRESGKSREWLAENLFANMSSIDFDGDGQGGEYGDAFIGLEPVDSRAKQPFHFGEYQGVFRWYTYAIHGTRDESRIGECVTGGCVNVGKENLMLLVEALQLGDLVEITQPN